MNILICDQFKGILHPIQKSTCFVLYLNLSTPFKSIIYASYNKLSKEFKEEIEILVDHKNFKLWIKQSEYCFDHKLKTTGPA